MNDKIKNKEDIFSFFKGMGVGNKNTNKSNNKVPVSNLGKLNMANIISKQTKA